MQAKDETISLHPESPPATEGNFMTWLLIGAALVLGLLRFVRIGTWSLWIDEVFTWGDAHSELTGNYNHAGYHVIRWWVETFNGGVPSEAALRMAPAIVGYLCIPLTLFAFTPIAGRRRAALAALFVALSAWQIQWSQTARFYTFCEAAALLGTGIAVRGLIRESVWRIIVGVGIAGAGVAFQLQGAIFAAALGFALWFACPVRNDAARRAARIAFIALAVAGLIASPWVWKAWLDYAEQKAVESAAGSIAHFVQSTVWFVTPALIALSLGGLLMGLLRGERGSTSATKRGATSAEPDDARVLRFALCIPVVMVLALLLAATQAVVTAQYAFALFPWIALVAAWPVAAVLGTSARARAFPWAWTAAGVAPLLASTFLYLTVEKGQRARWREAVSLVMELRDPTDLVASTPAIVTEFYLTGGIEKEVRRHDSVMQLDFLSWDDYKPFAATGRTIWFVVRNDFLLRYAPEDRAVFDSFLHGDCRLVKSFPVHVEARDLTIDVWRFSAD